MSEHKRCSKCGIEHIYPNDFHKTSRKYESSSGLEEIRHYYHAKCKNCRNKEKKEYLKKEKERHK